MHPASAISLRISLVAAVLLPLAQIQAQVVQHQVPDDSPEDSATGTQSVTLYQGSRKMRDLGDGRMVVAPTSWSSLNQASEEPLTILPALDSPALRLALGARAQESGIPLQIPPPVFPPEPVDPDAGDARKIDPPALLPPLGPAIQMSKLRLRNCRWPGWPLTPIFGSLEYYPPAWLACQHHHRHSWSSHSYLLW
jgi:hypothetical protein